LARLRRRAVFSMAVVRLVPAGNFTLANIAHRRARHLPARLPARRCARPSAGLAGAHGRFHPPTSSTCEAPAALELGLAEA
jgi:hypothetical protein